MRLYGWSRCATFLGGGIDLDGVFIGGIAIGGDVVDRTSLARDEDVASAFFFFILEGYVAIDLGASYATFSACVLTAASIGDREAMTGRRQLLGPPR